jgi:hypothetical protein
MSKLLRWLVSSLGVALVMGVCAQTFADLTSYMTLNPYTPGTTASYGTGAGDYQSRQDANSPNVPVPGPNDLLSATVGQGGGTGGLNVQRIGLGELITPKTGGTYGSLNNHALTVNTITMPFGGGGGNPLVTLKITPGTLTSDGSTPTSPTDGAAGDIWVPGATAYTNTFTFSSTANSLLTTLDLAGANAADAVNNPAAPALALDQTYLVSIEWGFGANFPNNTANSMVWYRGLQVDPGGQIMIELNQAQGFKTFAAAPFGAGAPRGAALAINVPVPIPEPATFVLLGLAVPAFGWVARRCKA